MTTVRLTLALLAACTAIAQPSITIALPDHPFDVALTPDGSHILVSLGPASHGSAEIAVLNRENGQIHLARTAKFKAGAAFGMVLSHDGKLLILAARESVVFLDVPPLIDGSGNPVLGSFTDGKAPGSVHVNISPDEKLLFVADETQRSITAIDLERTRAQSYQSAAVIGAIPTGTSPIALVFSPDGKWLYTSAQVAAPDWNWPKACKAQQDFSAKPALVLPQGAVVVVDTARAGKDPANSVVARVPAGCAPVRLAISPGGDRLYATARNQNSVLAFDTSKLRTDAMPAVAQVGMSPVPVAVFDGGRKVIVGNSNRFGVAGETSELTVLDATTFQILGTIPSGAFPREMAVSPDGRTLFLTNFNSRTLQAIDLDHLPLKP
jgi:DNA-binding beta-propeller fold protein YncE